MRGFPPLGSHYRQCWHGSSIPFHIPSEHLNLTGWSTEYVHQLWGGKQVGRGIMSKFVGLSFLYNLEKLCFLHNGICSAFDVKPRSISLSWSPGIAHMRWSLMSVSSHISSDYISSDFAWFNTKPNSCETFSMILKSAMIDSGLPSRVPTSR